MQMLTYQQALRTVQPIILPTLSALQTGLDHATELHATSAFRRRDDPHFYSHAVRRRAVEQLREMNLRADEDTGFPALKLSGIMIFYRDILLRVLRPDVSRSGNIAVPLPGRSAARQRFWRQEPTLPGTQADNLLLLWRDDDGALLEPLKLVRPLGGDHRRRSLRLHWAGPLSRSMAGMQAEDLDGLVPDEDYAKLGNGDAG